ncbi:MAG: hypothetical protein JST45_01565 [Bacteroidetes bacterium]|nr:hypothetical protein [Bacteroidota bacterium]
MDIRLVQGTTADQLKVQLMIHSTAPFGGILSAVTVTIRYDASSGASLGAGSSFCTAWSSFTPSPTTVNNGIAYRTYNGFGVNRLEDAAFDGGCDTVLTPEQWFTITTIPVSGNCTAFTLGNDGWTAQNNRNYYLSMGGFDLTGQVVGGPVSAGACGTDCLGVPGGTALPGTPCDDGDPNTTNDTWTADCQCAGSGCMAPTVTGTSSNTPVCSNTDLALGVTATGTGPLSYAWTGAGTFSPNATSADVTVGGAASGSYQVVVSNACGSTNASISAVVTNAPSASIAYSGSPYCSSAGTVPVTRTGTSGGTYSASPSGLALNTGNGSINPGNSTAGSYTVTYTIPASGGCTAFSTTATLVITAAPSAAISYAGSPYCSSAGTVQVTRTGTSGGTYSASPSGLAVNTGNGNITPANSTAGNYTVTYTIPASGGCTAFSITAPVVITAAPSAAINYAGSPYCTNSGTAQVTRTGTSGGTYSASPSGLALNTGNGNINPGNSTAGSYTVTYTVPASGGCAAFSTTATVVITPAPNASISYAGSPYCSSSGVAQVTRTGTGGGTFSASPSGLALNSGNGNINPGNSTAGSYTVTYTIPASGGCTAFSTTATVVITAAPSATINYAGSPYCTNSGTAQVTRTGTSGGTYSASPSGLALNTGNGNINPGNSSAGSYTVTYTVPASGGCTAFSTTATVVITAAPNASISYTGSPYCGTTGTAAVTRTGHGGGSYTAAPPGLAINASSGAINLGNSSAGTYTVTYTIAANGGCGAFTTTATVVINAPATWYADTDSDGFGDNSATLQACSQPPGYVATGGDLCPDDGNKIEPGACGCGVPDTDSDKDGIADCIDSCPLLEGQVGDPCDDGNAGTEDDVITADCTCAGILTAVAEQGAMGGWLLWPNPAHGQVMLQAPVSGPVVIEVVDAEGRLVQQLDFTITHGTVSWPTSSLARGAYAVRVLAPHAVRVLRLVVE